MDSRNDDALVLWERQPGETAKQYTKFCKYRDMIYLDVNGKALNKPTPSSARRSLRRLAASMGLSSSKSLEALSVKFNWTARAEAYDLDIERRAREQQEQAILQMKKDHASVAAAMIKKATKRLLTIPEEDISASDIIRLVDTGVKIERLSRGESTENRHISGEATLKHTGEVKTNAEKVLNLSDLSDEELGQLEGVLEKLYREPGVPDRGDEECCTSREGRAESP